MSALNTPPVVQVAARTEAILLSLQVLSVTAILVFTTLVFQAGESCYLGFGLMGALIVHLATRPPWREILLAGASSFAFAGIYLLLHGKIGDYFGITVGLPGGFLGMGSLLVLSSKWIFAPPAARPSRFEVLREASLIPILCMCSTAAVILAIRFTPLTYDRLLYAFDYKFGGPPSWVVGRLVHSHVSILLLSVYAYNSLPLGMAACMWLRSKDRRNPEPPAADLLWMAVSLGIVGFLLYQLVPAAGPVYLFPGQFPREAPSIMGLSLDPAPLGPVPRNAMPSLHVAWMLLFFWSTRRQAWWIRLIAAVYLVLTILATLGLGEHYLVDLIVVPPLVLAIQAACTRISASVRWTACITGAAITLAWLIALRTGAAMLIPAGAPVWSLAAVSLLVSMTAAWMLERAARPAPADLTTTPAPHTVQSPGPA